MRTITLQGSGTARGLAHGEALRELVVEAAERWRADVGGRLEAHLAALVDDSGFIATAQRFVPDVVDEIDGVSRASGVDRRTVWALNLMDEDWWMREHTAARSACSAFGVLPGDAQPALVAQNMDLPGWLDGLQVLLDIRPDDGPRVLAPSYAGMVATNVLNEHGIGVCVNSLPQLATSGDGLAVALMLRLLATQRTHGEALDVLRTAPHATGQNYIVGAPDTVVDLECGAGTITEVAPTGDRVAHTNHPIASGEGSDVDFLSNSPARLAALRDRLAVAHHVGPHDAVAILRQPPLCRGSDGDAGFTFYSVAMECTADPTLHAVPAPTPTDSRNATCSARFD